jgi:hypothetical protein
MRTKHTAKKLAKQLTAGGHPRRRAARQPQPGHAGAEPRRFTDGTTRVLVATDIAARGIHVDDSRPVVHVDPPTEHKAYLHRSGRTARAGAGGHGGHPGPPEQARDVRTLAKQAGIAPTTVAVRPGAPEITSVAGPAAPYVEPAVVVAQPARPRTTPARSGGRAAAPGGGARRGGARGGGGQAPARTRAELAARAGQPQPVARRPSR